MTITLLGLGPGPWPLVTLEAQAVLQESESVLLRTSRHPTVDHLPAHLRVESCDDLYESASSFEEVYAGIVERVWQRGQEPGGVVYAVPGHPLVAEATSRALLVRAREAGVPIRVVVGLSFLEPTWLALGVDPVAEAVQIVDALTARLDPARPALVAQLHNRWVASELKGQLLDLYPAETAVRLVRQAGLPAERVETLELAALDRPPSRSPRNRGAGGAVFDHLTCLYLPALPLEQNLRDFGGFAGVIARLRGPDGCPWDRAQTHASLKPHLLEEAYEVIEAIDAADPAMLCEELGDLMMQALLHAQLAADDGEFDIRDVLAGITAKLIRRHPHVFGAAQVADAEQVKVNWEALKAAERVERGEAEKSALAGVPNALPALAQAFAVQQRAKRAGFDWVSADGPLAKVAEEVAEIAAAPDATARAAEWGDLLFSLVGAARHADVDPEDALRQATARFRARFAVVEQLCREQGVSLPDLALDQKRALWAEAKHRAAAS